MSGSSNLPIRITVDGVQQADAAMQQIAASGERVGRQLRAAADSGTQGFGRFNQALQSGGYQVQDFAVQVQGGTSALTALSQQGSQFLGIFGTGGAIAGAVLTVGILAYKFLEGGDAAEKMGQATKSLDSYFQNLERSADGVTSSLEAQVKMLKELRSQYANLDAAQREYERRELDRQGRKLDEAAATLQGEARSGVGTRSIEFMRRSAEMDVARMNFGQDPLGVPVDVQNLSRILRDIQSNNGLDPSQLSAYGTQLEAIAKGSGRAAQEARTALEALDKLLPRARELATSRQRLELARTALNGETTLLDTVPPNEPTDGPPDPSRSRGGRGRANPADRADTTGTLDKILQDQDKAARALGASLSPAIAAWEKYQETIDKVRLASDLYYRTIDRVGGPLGISPEQAAEFESLAKDQYEAALKRIEEQGNKTGQTMESAFGKATSALENALVTGGDLADTLQGLEQDIVRLIYRMTIMQQMETAGKAAGDWLSRLAGDIAGNYFGSGTGGTIGDKGVTVSTTKTTGVSGGAKFANGGIMTSQGPLPLRAYASGGIANSPQLALFGEGRMPEAYVPLPDGRSIPVTMEGQGGGLTYAPNVSIDARGADAGSEARMLAGVNRMLQAHQAKFVADVQRGGAMSKSMGRRR